MFKEIMKIRGDVSVYLNGSLVREVNNLVVDSGKNLIMGRLTNTDSAVMSHLALGTGATAASVDQIALLAEVSRRTLTSVVHSSNTVTYTASFPPGVATATLTEAGIFNNPAGGTMLARVTFGVLTKGPDDSVVVSWVITLV